MTKLNHQKAACRKIKEKKMQHGFSYAILMVIIIPSKYFTHHLVRSMRELGWDQYGFLEGHYPKVLLISD